MAKVLWAARALVPDSTLGSVMALGNHQFVCVVLKPGEKMLDGRTPVHPLGHEDLRFCTFAAFNIGNQLKVWISADVDVRRVQNAIKLGPKEPSWPVNLRKRFLEGHAIAPPRGNALAFAWTIERLAYNYASNGMRYGLLYDKQTHNCASWVNTLLKLAGVPSSVRARSNDFRGIDAGQDNLIDETMFQSRVQRPDMVAARG